MSEKPAKVDLASPDLAAEKRAAFEDLFPGVLVDGVLDATRLGELLDTPVAQAADARERFGLMWAGKQEAVRSLLKPSRGALVPDLENSIDFDTAQNVFIEGDNLEVLKLLQKAYNDKVKLIYIDPPYNTGNDFVYNDDFADGLRGYLHYTGQLDDEGKLTSASAETSGRRHSKWLSMMYPRLVLARNLLCQDGVLMVHIDEHEAPRLLLLLDEVFGPDNNLGDIIWDKRNPKGDAGGVSSQHETVLVFARSKADLLAGSGLRRPKNAAQEMLSMAGRLWASIGTKRVPQDLEDSLQRHGIPLEVMKGHEVEVTPDVARRQFVRWLRGQPFSGGELAYNNLDDEGQVFRLVSMAWPNKKQAPPDYWIPLVHPVTGRACPVPARGWRNPPATMAALLEAGRIVFGPDETTQPQRKYLLSENMTTNVASVIPFGGSDDRLLEEMAIPFDTAKPVDLIRSLVASATSDGDLVVDFFAGSGSTAHAVALQNVEDGGRRRVISVNIPEPTSDDSAASKAGFTVVSDITLARLAWVNRNVEGAADQGLRVLSLSRSGFRRHDAADDELDLSETTLVINEPYVNGLVSEVLLAEGVALDAPWARHHAGGEDVVVADGVAVVVCLDITDEVVGDALALAPRTLVFLEDGFAAKDAVKANAFTRARNAGITMKTV